MINLIEVVSGKAIVSSNYIGSVFSVFSKKTPSMLQQIGINNLTSMGLAGVATASDAWISIGKGEGVINATTKGVVHTIMGTAIIGKSTAIGASIGTAIPAPVLGTAIGALAGFGVGVLISMGADKVFDVGYDNTIGQVVDWTMDNSVGKFINQAATNFVNDTNKAIDNVIDGTVDTIKDVGNAVGGFFNGLGSVFN